MAAACPLRGCRRGPACCAAFLDSLQQIAPGNLRLSQGRELKNRDRSHNLEVMPIPTEEKDKLRHEMRKMLNRKNNKNRLQRARKNVQVTEIGLPLLSALERVSGHLAYSLGAWRPAYAMPNLPPSFLRRS